jgi:hypothetical protein
MFSTLGKHDDHFDHAASALRTLDVDRVVTGVRLNDLLKNGIV